eukprot:gene7741-12211_t
MSAGKIFRESIKKNKPLQCVGTINAFTALMAQKSGHQAIYLSGSGVATASHGLPDLGITNLNDVVEDAKRITSITKLPLLVDIDTGFGGAFGIARTIQQLEKVGVAAVHIEDQIAEKRCGHRPNKQIVSIKEMTDRIKVATSTKSDPDFVIMARTDSFANEGLERAIERCQAYIEAGAEMLFPEAITKLSDYEKFSKAFPNIPILANITEFGKTPLFTTEELESVGVSIALYPLSAHRAMCKAAMNVYSTLLNEKSAKSCLSKMQTRDELYDILDYHKFENFLDELNK